MKLLKKGLENSYFLKKMMISILMILAMAGITTAAYDTSPIALGSELVATFISQTPDPVEPADSVELRFKIENTGTERADDVQVEILPEYPFSLHPSETKVKNLGAINGRQMGSDAVIVKFKVSVDKDAISGTHDLDIRYKYKKSEWIKLKDNEINVQSHFATLSVTDVISEPQEIRPGETAKVTIHLENMADSLLQDIKVNLELLKTVTTTTGIVKEEKPFTPIGSSNEKKINNLERERTAKVEFNLKADPDAEPGVYKIPIMTTYSDNAGKNYSNSNIIGLVIGDQPDLLIIIDNNEFSKANTKGTVDIKFVNKAQSDIKFLYIVLQESEAYDILSSEKVYVGNIDSDDYETTDFELYLKKVEDNKVMLPLEIEYRDSNNQFYKKQINVPLKVMPEITEEGEGSNTLTGIIIVVVIVVVGYFGYRRFRKKKR